LNPDFDILIAGGGPVGLSLALALNRMSYRIGLIEARDPAQASTSHGRRYALSLSSRHILETLAVWPGEHAVPIRKIHVSEQGGFGAAHLNCEQEGIDAFGYVVDSRELEQSLYEAVCKTPVQRLYGSAVSAVKTLTDTVELHRTSGTTPLHCRLLLAADGVQSSVREILGIETQCSDYGQSAIVAELSLEHEPGDTAYERFSRQGAMAMLPLRGKRGTLIWTRDTARAQQLLTLPDMEFLPAAEQAFGRRLGRFLAVHSRLAFPLRLVRAKNSVQDRIALMGTAAQSVHPVAAQGLNLALRDVAALAETLACGTSPDPGEPARLARYADWRRQDVDRTVRFTDFLARAFAIDLPGLRMARSAGLLMIDMLPGAKHALTRLGLGLRGRPPAAALGIPFGS
jgi:2-octaprenyl-6-methoxyphenol hydroxylase